MKNIKILILFILLVWLIPTVITAFIVPAFHKTWPKPASPQIHKDREFAEIIDENGDALLRRLQLIESAENELILSTYYLADDDAGKDVMAALNAAAERGVHIRILIDGFCAFTSHVTSGDHFQALLSNPSVEAKIYNPVNLLMPFDENYRMHDKYLVADRTAFILGGRNTRNKSIGSYSGKIDADRDAFIYCDGPDSSVTQLLSYFEGVWNDKNCHYVKHSNFESTAESFLKNRYENLKSTGLQPLKREDFLAFMTPVKNVNLFSNPSHSGRKAPQLWTDLMFLMGEGTDIEIQTPYIILSRQMHEQFYGLTQGRQIKIITNAPETGANPMGCAELLNRKKHLLKTGFRLFEYGADRSSHVKSVVIDDHLSLVGSFNFDMRSAYLDTETMLLIDSPEINRELRATNQKYMRSSRCSQEKLLDQPGEHFLVEPMGKPQKFFYGVLRALIVPFRHLL